MGASIAQTTPFAEWTPEVEADLRRELRPAMRAFRDRLTQELLHTMSGAAHQGKADVISEVHRAAGRDAPETDRAEFAEPTDAPGVDAALGVMVDKAFVSDVLQTRHQYRALTWASVKSEELLNQITNTVREAMDRGGAGVEESLASVFRGWVSDGTVDPATGDKLLNPHKLEAIHRTEAMKAYNEGRNEIMFDDDVEIVEAVQYSAILDSRTSPFCRKWDGTVLANTPENEAQIAELTPPNHVHCRSLLVPVTGFEDWEETPDAGRPNLQPQQGFGVIPGVEAEAADA